MRIAAAVLLLLAACATGSSDGTIVDAVDGNAPFSWVAGGFSSRNPQLGAHPSSEEMTFIFENVSDRPQTAERLFIRQRNEGSAPLRVDATSVQIGKMIDPGEELEVKALVSVAPQIVREGARIGDQGIVLDLMLKHGDGTTYRYPIQVPVARTIGIRP